MPRLFPAGFVTPCQPSAVQVPPIGADWLHEIKHDGFRMMVQRAGGRPQRPRLGGALSRDRRRGDRASGALVPD
jgi:hypothetical protein